MLSILRSELPVRVIERSSRDICDPRTILLQNFSIVV